MLNFKQMDIANINFYTLETAKEPHGLWGQLPPAQLLTTNRQCGGFTLSF